MIFWLGEGEIPNRERIGGKGWSLASLERSGFPVPNGFVVTTTAFQETVRSLGLPPEELPGPEPTSADPFAAWRDRVQEAEMEASLREALLQARRRLLEQACGGARSSKLAVRSSATAEDSASLSFAGQHDTRLGVEGEAAYLDAIKACWASLWSERALAYRRRKGVDGRSLAMAVVVQPVVEAEVSGLLFTVDPLDARGGRMRISAVKGAGEALVSGRVQPTDWLLDREDFAGQPPDGPPPLDGEQVLELARVGLKIESHFGSPQDIEWARSKGRFVILQSRPITASRAAWPAVPVDWGHDANAAALQGKLLYWSNWNTRENFPYPLRPLAWSFMQHLALPAITRNLSGIRPDSPFFAPSYVIDLVFGRVYWNMNLLAGHPLLGRFMMSKMGIIDREAGEAFGPLLAEGKIEVYRPRIRRRDLWRTKWRMLLTVVRFPWLASIRRIHRRCQRFFEDSFAWERIPLEGKTTGELFALARRIVDRTAGTTFPLLVVAVKSILALNGIERLARGWGRATADAFLTGIPGNRTSEGVLELFALSQKAKPLAEVITAAELSNIEEALAASEEGRQLLREMDAFLHRHGHRGCKDLDISYPSWSLDRTFLWQTIRAYWHLPPESDPARLFAAAVERRLALTRDLEEHLSRDLLGRLFPIKKWLFRRFLKLAHDFFPLRENSKYYGLRLFPPVRRIFLFIGERLHRAGLLGSADEVFYLTIPEIEELSGQEKPDSGLVRSQIQARRVQWESYCRMDPPFIVRSDGEKIYSRAEPGGDRVLRGLGVSSGRITGRARIIHEPSEGGALQAGEILVAPYTEPGWTPLFLVAAGLVMEVGGAICHGAIVSREFGIPAVVGVRAALRFIHDGDRITLDGDAGTITLESSER